MQSCASSLEVVVEVEGNGQTSGEESGQGDAAAGGVPPRDTEVERASEAVAGPNARETVELFVVFDSEHRVYMPGDKVEGRIGYKIDLLKHELRSLSVSLYGYLYSVNEKTDEIESRTSLSSDSYFIGAEDLNTSTDSDELEFYLYVPPNSPGSFATSLGGIEYTVETMINYEDKNRKGEPLKIVKLDYVSVIVPVKIAEEESVSDSYTYDPGCLLRCCLGYVSCYWAFRTVELLCGDVVRVNIRIDNESSIPVVMTFLKLCQRVTRHSDGKVTVKEVLMKARGSVMGHQSQVWMDEKFLIPPLHNSMSNSMFDIYYYFQLELSRNISPYTIKMDAPVTIGNIAPRQQIPDTWPPSNESMDYRFSQTAIRPLNLNYRPLCVNYPKRDDTSFLFML